MRAVAQPNGEREDAPLRWTSRDLIARLAGGPEIVYLFWPVILGYLRIVTHPGILPKPFMPLEAEANMTGLIDRLTFGRPRDRGFRRFDAIEARDPFA